MSAAADVLDGVTLTGGTSGWSASLTGISQSGISRSAHESTPLTAAAPGAGTFANRTYVFGDLTDGGTLELEGLFNPDTEPPIDQPAETWTVQFEASGGDATGASFAFSGGMTDFSWSGERDGLMSFSSSIKISGAVTQTAGA